MSAAHPNDSIEVAPLVPTVDATSLAHDVHTACERVAPLWPLRHFVAVNAYLGFADLPFDTAMRRVSGLFDAHGYMPLDYYRGAAAEGRITNEDLDAARKRMAMREAALYSRSDDAVSLEATQPTVFVDTLAETIDRQSGSDLAARIVDHLGRWCAGRFDDGQASWPQPWSELEPFPAWRAYLALDHSLDATLPGLRDYVAELPASPLEALAAVLGEISIAPEFRADYLTRLLSSVIGWAGHARYRQWIARLAGGDDDSVVHLLAARAAYEGALARQNPDLALHSPRLAPVDAFGDVVDGRERAVRAEWQCALETGHQRRLIARLRAGGSDRTAAAARPSLQAVFCIDVRSESLRRHLEAQDDGIQTLGFAGFFGLPIELESPDGGVGTARCPALLAPGVAAALGDDAPPGAGARLLEGVRRGLAPLKKLGVTSFPFVEALGGVFGARLVSDSVGLSAPASEGGLVGDGRASRGTPRLQAEHDQRVDLAEGMLRGMGLVEDFASVVMLCGHGSRSANNPFASSLDCGACGGHSGEANARVAAALLSDPAVRDGLGARGIEIPSDTVFVAALHDTMTDRVHVLGDDALPAMGAGQLDQWLHEAAVATRRERARRFGIPASDDALAAQAERRANDWSEVRPEWALAGNAAFIAAPRSWTRGVDLEGRCFLHDYSADGDPDGSTLASILTAPLVVASWINLQYYASTVDNERLGAGDKTIHNVVGRAGVVCGNEADLRVGLPLQSVHDGERFVHEPLRLTGLIAAAPEAIDAVIASSDTLRELVENEWIDLYAWDRDADRFTRRGVHRGVWIEAEDLK